uniref:HTH-like domain-containing protein n=1 Tax=Ralstonia solanacearum TaxID=305 RepID=A0A809ECB5_RALSL
MRVVPIRQAGSCPADLAAGPLIRPACPLRTCHAHRRWLLHPTPIVHYGYRRVHVMLQREGWEDNHKRVYRLYRADGLWLRHKRPKRNKSARLARHRHPITSVGMALIRRRLQRLEESFWVRFRSPPATHRCASCW